MMVPEIKYPVSSILSTGSKIQKHKILEQYAVYTFYVAEAQWIYECVLCIVYEGLKGSQSDEWHRNTKSME